MGRFFLFLLVLLMRADGFALSMPQDSLRVSQVHSDIQTKKQDLISAVSLQKILMASTQLRRSQLLAHSYLLARVLRLRKTYGGETTPQQAGYLKLTLGFLLRNAAQEEAEAREALQFLREDQDRLQTAENIFRFKMRFFLEKLKSQAE